MSNEIDKKLQQLLRMTIPPLRERALKYDLWPRVVRRLDERAVHIPWFDWALAAVPIVCLLFYPELIPILLYLL